MPYPSMGIEHPSVKRAEGLAPFHHPKCGGSGEVGSVGIEQPSVKRERVFGIIMSSSTCENSVLSHPKTKILVEHYWFNLGPSHVRIRLFHASVLFEPHLFHVRSRDCDVSGETNGALRR